MVKALDSETGAPMVAHREEEAMNIFISGPLGEMARCAGLRQTRVCPALNPWVQRCAHDAGAADTEKQEPVQAPPCLPTDG